MNPPIDKKAKREEKLKSSLRSNLLKRKNQARARSDSETQSAIDAKDTNNAKNYEQLETEQPKSGS